MTTDPDSFEAFFEDAEPKIRVALSATFGHGAGREAAVDALSYGWEHWDRVRAMENPAGYLYAVGRDRARKRHRRRPPVAFDPVDATAAPWIEPELPDALARLPEQQRIVVMLLYCFDWTMTEVAHVLDVSKSTVQTHAERGLDRLRSRMGVAL
ncbi:MAG: sigma-70 family RNA polymerase sigma factor [Ilumatobacter sp.]|nr:sigma-70 family RNA polymerase sigma factor [Ilumatobacter sp.]